MSPQERSTPASKPVPNGGFSVRKLPGFRAAAAAFVLVVLLGGGGIAVAKWNQSANVTVGITAGVAPAPAGQGNIVASPAIAQRPAAMQGLTCSRISGGYRITWNRDTSSAVNYFVSINGSLQPNIVTANTYDLKLANSNAAYGNYTVRIQPMRGEVAGDPVENTINHGKNPQPCGAPKPALGNFAVQGVTAKNSPNVLNLNWDPAANATSYKVSVQSRDIVYGTYGTEFTTSSLAATLTFPRAAGWPNYYGQYELRIQPMMGEQAGDPVYKSIQYSWWGTAQILN